MSNVERKRSKRDMKTLIFMLVVGAVSPVSSSWAMLGETLPECYTATERAEMHVSKEALAQEAASNTGKKPSKNLKARPAGKLSRPAS